MASAPLGQRLLRAVSTLAGSVGVGATLAACGGGVPAAEWIGTESAVVKCAPSHPRGLPVRLVDDLPHPDVPSGLFARQLDPLGLDGLGFERDTPVCAILEPPPTETLEAARDSIDKLLTTWSDLDGAMWTNGPCGCELLRGDPRAGMFAACQGQTAACQDLEAAKEVLVGRLEAFDAAVRETRLPYVHWRLVGRVDRSEWFIRNLPSLLGRHSGGSLVHTRGEPLPDGFGRSLVEGLFTEPDVRVVIRQDSGLAFLVVRLRGTQLILDHFSHGPIDPRRLWIVASVDDAQVDHVRARLQLPVTTRRLELDPRGAFLVELDKVGLDRVEELLEVTRALGPGGAVAPEAPAATPDGAPAAEEVDESPFRRVTFRVPRDDEDTVQLRLLLGTAARDLLQSVSKSSFAEFAREQVRQSADQPPTPAPEPIPELLPGIQAAMAAPMVYRGTTIERTWFAQPREFFSALVELEQAVPGSVDGRVESFEVELPTGPLPGSRILPKELMPLMTRISLRRYRLSGSLDPDHLNLTLARR